LKAMTGLGVLIVIVAVLCAVAPEWIAPYSPTRMDPSNLMQPPSGRHWMGTDYFGRDMLSLVVYGSRDSLLIGLAAVAIGGVLGSAVGAIAGYIGGWFDIVVLRFIEILMTVPGILLSLAIAAALGPSLANVVLAIAVAAIPRYARVLRSYVIGVKNRTFILAAFSIGSSGFRTFFRHVLPGAMGPFLVMSTIGIGTSILTGSGLSFLGLGPVRENPDWGTVLAQGRSYLTAAWWICSFPGLAIAMLVLSINIIGDDLRDLLDPRNNRN